MKKDDALAEAVAEMSDDERARLPARLRKLARGKAADAWADAKAARDAAIEAATGDPDMIAAARAAWQAAKAAIREG